MFNNILENSIKKAALIATRSKFIRNMIEKRQISMEFPASLFIEPTNLCNLKCSMCPQSIVGLELSPPLMGGDKGEGEMKEDYHPHPDPLPSRERGNGKRIKTEPIPKVERGFMDFDLYKSIIDESLRFGKRMTIFFHKDGEPLLHPKLPEMIEYAVSRKAAYQTHLSTNAMLLNQKIMDSLLKSGIDSIIINIDAATEETYKKIKRVSGLDKVEENVKNFLETKKKLGLIKPLIRVKLISVEENLGEIEAFKKKWDKLADEVVISREFSWPGFMGKKDSAPGYENNGRYPCISLWLALAINWDGTVSVCCIDFYHRGILGNLRESTINEIWKGEKLKTIRVAHLDGKFNSVSVCSDCRGLWLRDTLGRGSEKWLREKMEKAEVI